MALVGALIGLPMFFEIGLVLLMPVILLVARRSGQSLVRIGIPTLAGLSVMHGLVPPHPGPLVAIDALKADLGVTLGLGVLVAIPTAIIAGPRLRQDRGPLGRRPRAAAVRPTPRSAAARPSSFPVTLATVLLPVVLMLAKAMADIVVDDETQPTRQVVDIVGTP